MSTANLVPFKGVEPESVEATIAALRTTYKTGRTRNLEYRKKQLRKLYWGLVDNSALVEAALYKDLKKPVLESQMTEIEWCKAECLDAINNMDSWAKSQKVPHVPAKYWLMGHHIRYEPLGLILVISAYNYPLMLALTPLIGAIAAGNVAVVKPSEGAPATAMVLQKLVDEYLDPEAYACINGNVPVTKAVLDVKFDKIIFTGGRTVGSIVAKKAAETMTPVILELGGQNPAFIPKNANVKLAARRLTWAKTHNTGQVCLSHNYALVDRSHVDLFIQEIKANLKEFYPKGAQNTPDFGRIVNKANFDRMKKMLDNTKGRIVIGGTTDADDLYIEPTVVLVDDINDSMVVEESFGPTWSILPVDSLNEAIDIANKVDPTPLALYAWGTKAETEKILDNVASGGATINDGIIHAGINPAPIGGIGKSGQGNYHGVYSFRAFSHERTIASVPSWIEKGLALRYPPFTEGKLSMALTGSKVGFDRDGNITKGLGYWLGLLLRLGGKSATGSVSRWALLIALAFVASTARQRLDL